MAASLDMLPDPLLHRVITGHEEGQASAGVLDGVNGREYDGVWKAWKLGSLGLFAVFVLAMIDAARTLRRIAAQ